MPNSIDASALARIAMRGDSDGAGGGREPALIGLARASARQSTLMWGFSLCDALPHVLTRDGVTAVAGEIQRVVAFLSEHFALFSEETHGSQPSDFVRAAKREYLEHGCDLVELRHADATIGVLIGAPEDWSSYYVRAFALRPDFQRPEIARRFARECLFAPLAEHGVERVCAETSPANVAMSRILTELRFHVTGSHLSDRWGPMIRYTRFLSPRCEGEFVRKFGRAAPISKPRGQSEKS